MKLVIVSATPHHIVDGHVVGWGPTIREIDYLARLFDQVVHLAPLYAGDAPASSIPYKAQNVRLSAIEPAGGTTLIAKLGVLRRLPSYVVAILRQLPGASAVHVRLPANVSLVALLLLFTRVHPRKRWFKYAGNWRPLSGDPLSYRLQRRLLLSPAHRGQVTINGDWDDQTEFVTDFNNPCFSLDEWQRAQESADRKSLADPLTAIFVGRVERPKGILETLEILKLLDERSHRLYLEVVGDGPMRAEAQQRARELGLESRVNFHGFLPRSEVEALYQKAHFTLLPSSSEGWPKVLSEGMAHGAIPIASAVSAIAQTLARMGGGVAVEQNTESYTEAIESYLDAPEQWRVESLRLRQAARHFSYETHVERVRDLLALDEEVSAP